MWGLRRCASCHEQAGKNDRWVFDLPDSFFIRIDRPQWNNFLRAPLALAVEGTEKCGQAVFANTQDRDYQRIVQSFAALQRKLQRRPRVDMLKDPDIECLDGVAVESSLNSVSLARPVVRKASTE